MIRVYINGRFIGQRTTGVQRYAWETLRALDADETWRERYSFVLLTAHRDGEKSAGFVNIEQRPIGRLSGQAWEQLELPVHAKDGLLVNLCNLGPLFKGRQLVTIHDASIAALPRNYTWRFRAWYGLALPILCRRSRLVLTDSEFSKFELMRFFEVGAEKVRVAPLGLEHIVAGAADNAVLSRHGLRPGEYVLGVASVSPHKNLSNVVRAMELVADPRPVLVLVGGTNRKIFANERLSSGPLINHLGYVTDAELRALYENAACFVYPSLYEGFGLPPGEAMACGCPTVVSGIPALKEICGDAALYCDPSDPKDIAQKISQAIRDKNLRDSLAAAGRARAGQFTWRRCAAQLLSAVDEAMRR